MARFTDLLVLLVFTLFPQGHGTTFTIGDREFSHRWNTVAKMPTKRSDLTATTLGDAIYLIGGCSVDQEWSSGSNMYGCSGLSKETEKYMPATNSFTTLNQAPRTRYRHAAVALGTRIYLLGGRDIQDNILSQVDVLDTVSGTWSTLGTDMPNATSDLSAFVANGKIYVVGGYTASYTAVSTMMMFNPLESGAAAWTSGPPLQVERGDHFTVVAAGLAYAVGGFTHTNNWAAPLAEVEMFDPTLPSAGWRPRMNLTIPRGDKAVAALHNVVHVIGGETKNRAGDSVPVMDVEAYDSGRDRWIKGGSIPSHRFRFVAASHGDSIFLFGGQGQLIGAYKTDGSRYPVLDRVEQYEETVENVAVDTAPQGAVAWAALVTAAASMWLQL